MRFAFAHRSFVQALVIATLLVAAFTVLCPNGVHRPQALPLRGICAAMPHTTGAGFASAAKSAITTLFAAFGLALAAALSLLMRGRVNLAAAPIAAPSVSPDPLHGRLRI